MKVAILGKDHTRAYIEARKLVLSLGHEAVSDINGAELAIAPLLTDILSPGQIYAPKYGTLIFHPSPLPYGRGASAIKWAYKRNEPITAATWFWANLYKVDSGDICEQEVIKIDYSLPPREFYDVHAVPALLRTLERALTGIAAGHIRRVPQVQAYSTFDFLYKKGS
ncbi:methionyl-tRNA formyltransferase [Dysgonomonas hofstadii]|uniref:Methionyl-tRNA formyltransferase n=1 Tax=Dysgonomonas hofstadii TaxID=637886 RepID=A0A840CHY3_9BACT|nr:formyltransferase family protein [Dysgonomonas hofstadii]MBB4034906.1 methionyl-tRNA formyltransferase [Dysgonomonas hofstadii]